MPVFPVILLTFADRSCMLFLKLPTSLGSFRSLPADLEEDTCSGNPAKMSLGFPLAGVCLNLAISKVASSVPGGLCISIVRVRARARGGAGRSAGSAGGGGGAEAASGSSYPAWSSKKEECCGEIVAELVGTALGSYATSEAAGGMKGFSAINHLRCLLRLF